MPLSGNTSPLSAFESSQCPASFQLRYSEEKPICGDFFVHSLQLAEVHLQNLLVNYYLQEGAVSRYIKQEPLIMSKEIPVS